MQSKLGPLTDNIRLIRCHIASLIPCDSGLPATIDELLFAIARGNLDPASFKNGCMCAGLGCQLRTSQPGQLKSLRTIHSILSAYVAGESAQNAVATHPEAKGFIHRSYQWLGTVTDLSDVQRKMLDRVLVTLGFFTSLDYSGTDPHPGLEGTALQDLEAMAQDVFYDQNGRGRRLDAKISAKAGLPKVHPEWDQPAYQEALATVEDADKRELYRTCCAIASGIHTASDCHHSTFRYIEAWIHGVATGRLDIPTRMAQSERQRLGHLLFGYALGLDKWLMRVPLQFLLLDLGHVDLGFDPRDNVLRVYACLGEQWNPVKEWLAACLWYTLVHNQQGGLIGSFMPSHTDLIEQCQAQGVTVTEWSDTFHQS